MNVRPLTIIAIFLIWMVYIGYVGSNISKYVKNTFKNGHAEINQ